MPTATKRKTKPAAAKRARKPVADRPDIPYGLKGPKEGSGLLPWSRVERAAAQLVHLLGLDDAQGRAAAQHPRLGRSGWTRRSTSATAR